mmetsp:Transcript_12581/g.22435  ORF Transcript_12581/g.22435 Transcript_12581/m.22435 type:complete len:214 (+) Transcript_12581:593-1234(+)
MRPGRGSSARGPRRRCWAPSGRSRPRRPPEARAPPPADRGPRRAAACTRTARPQCTRSRRRRRRRRRRGRSTAAARTRRAASAATRRCCRRPRGSRPAAGARARGGSPPPPPRGRTRSTCWRCRGRPLSRAARTDRGRQRWRRSLWVGHPSPPCPSPSRTARREAVASPSRPRPCSTGNLTPKRRAPRPGTARRARKALSGGGSRAITSSWAP